MLDDDSLLPTPGTGGFGPDGPDTRPLRPPLQHVVQQVSMEEESTSTVVYVRHHTRVISNILGAQKS